MLQKKKSYLYSRRKQSSLKQVISEGTDDALSRRDSQDEEWLEIVDDRIASLLESEPSALERIRKDSPERAKAARLGKPFVANSLQRAETGAPINLHQCSSQADIDSLRSYQTGAFLSKAVRPLKPKTVQAALGDRYAACMRVISGEGTDQPTMANHKALTDAYEHTGRGLIAMCNANPSLQVVFATIISGDGVTSSDMPVIDVEHEISKAKKFAAKVTKDFFGVVEIAHFNSHTHPSGGRVVQVHSHVLLIGEDIFEKAEAAAVTYGKKLPTNFTDAPQIQVKPVEADDLNLMKMASYLFKLPYQGKTWCPPRDGKRGHMHHSPKPDRSINFLRVAIMLTMMPLEKLVFAGGGCKSIKTGVVNDVRSNCKSASLSPDRLLAPDTIGAFWVEVCKSLKRPEWHLPVIITSR